MKRDTTVDIPREFLFSLIETSEKEAQKTLASIVLVLTEAHKQDTTLYMHNIETALMELDHEIDVDLKSVV